jgi:uncharacterized protein
MKKFLTQKRRTARIGIKRFRTRKSRAAGKQRRRSPRSRLGPLLARQGGLTYLEIPALDVSASAEFYTKVFGWLRRGNDPGQGRFTDPSGHLIGRWVVGRVARDPGLLPFIYVDHMHTAVETAAANGGGVVKAPYLEGTLLVAVVRDPAGNMIALWQEEKR